MRTKLQELTQVNGVTFSVEMMNAMTSTTDLVDAHPLHTNGSPLASSPGGTGLTNNGAPAWNMHPLSGFQIPPGYALVSLPKHTAVDDLIAVPPSVNGATSVGRSPKINGGMSGNVPRFDNGGVVNHRPPYITGVDVIQPDTNKVASNASSSPPSMIHSGDVSVHQRIINNSGSKHSEVSTRNGTTFIIDIKNATRKFFISLLYVSLLTNLCTSALFGQKRLWGIPTALTKVQSSPPRGSPDAMLVFRMYMKYTFPLVAVALSATSGIPRPSHVSTATSTTAIHPHGFHSLTTAAGAG